MNATFVDLRQREWRLAVNYATLKRLKAEAGVDFSVHGLGESYGKLLVDDQLALRVIWILVEASAGELTEDDWLAAMNGSVLTAALAAFHVGLRELHGPQKESLIDEAVKKVSAGWAKAIAECERHIGGLPENSKDLLALQRKLKKAR